MTENYAVRDALGWTMRAFATIPDALAFLREWDYASEANVPGVIESPLALAHFRAPSPTTYGLGQNFLTLWRSDFPLDIELGNYLTARCRGCGWVSVGADCLPQARAMASVHKCRVPQLARS